jgi:hypothetical protein
MNDKVKQLADKIWAEEYWDDPNTDKLLPIQLNKFAELIIKRCIELCDGNHEHKNHADTLFGKGVTTGIQLSQEAIKQHFGVK